MLLQRKVRLPTFQSQVFNWLTSALVCSMLILSLVSKVIIYVLTRLICLMCPWRIDVWPVMMTLQFRCAIDYKNCDSKAAAVTCYVDTPVSIWSRNLINIGPQLVGDCLKYPGVAVMASYTDDAKRRIDRVSIHPTWSCKAINTSGSKKCISQLQPAECIPVSVSSLAMLFC